MVFEIENDILKYVHNINEEEIIYVPDNVKTIASGAFDNLAISEVFVPDSVELIQKRAFVNCSIQKISIPENINTAGAFFRCITYNEIERRKRTTKTTVVEETHDAGAEPPETNYKQLFLDAVYAKGNTDKEKIFDNIYDDDVKIPLAVYFFTAYKSEKSKEYISDNFQKVMHYLVDKQDLNGINAVMSIKNKEQTI